MSYQVIARKYRPQRFADVVGQEHVTRTLVNAIERNRIAHAYLFCGPRGTGKTTIARIFAKCLNCAGGPKVDFAEDDLRCLEITEGRSIDVLEIDGASNNGVEQVRELRETVKYAPASSKFKVYIIDEVHMLTAAAFNALLKTLEEPPGHVKFMFATTDPERVIPTILSRCQRFDLRRIPAALIVQHLAKIAELEEVKIDEAALHAIARGADGGMRDAESTLDQLISFCGSEIQEADVLSMFGLAARAQVLALSQALLDGQPEVALRELDSLARGGKDLGRLLGDLLHHFRNLLVYKVSEGDIRLLEVSEAEAVALRDQSAAASPESLGRMLEVLTDAETRLRDALSKRVVLEVALLRTIHARSAVSVDALLQRLNQLRRETPEPAPGTPPAIPIVAPPPPTAQAPSPTRDANVATTPPPETPPVPTSSPAPPPASATPASDAALAALWNTVVEAVGRASPFLRSYLLSAFPVSWTNQVLTIGFEPEFAEYVALTDNTKNHGLLQTKLREIGHADARVRFVKTDRPSPAAPAPAPVPQAPAAAPTPTAQGPAETTAPNARTDQVDKAKPTRLDPQEFMNDPLIKQALETFRATIAEVRS